MLKRVSSLFTFFIVTLLVFSCGGGDSQKKGPPEVGSLASAFSALAHDSIVQDSLNRLKAAQEAILNKVTLKNGDTIDLKHIYKRLDSLFHRLSELGNVSEVERLEKVYTNTLVHNDISLLIQTDFFFNPRYKDILSKINYLKIARSEDEKLAIISWDRYTKVIPTYSKVSLYKVSNDSVNIKWISSFEIKDFKLSGEENFLVDTIYSLHLKDTSIVYMFYGQVKCGIWCVGQRLESFKISPITSNLEYTDFFPDKKNKYKIPFLSIKYDFRNVKKEPDQDKLSASFNIDSSGMRIIYPELESFTEKKEIIKTIIFDGHSFTLDKVKEIRLYKH